MDCDSRGHDTTIEVPSYRTPRDTNIIARVRAMLETPNNVEILRFKVGDSGPDGGTVKTYLGPRPDLLPASPMGRCTCRFQVVDEETMKKVYMKDSWRLLLDGVVSEVEAYKCLHAAKVPFIASFERGADVLGHMTITDVYREKGWAKATDGMMQYRHCRMVLGIAGRALTTFKSTRQLTQCVRDAVVAHKAAYEDANLLHRDISVGNILIGQNGRGCLIDWDLCKDADNLATNGKRLRRTGTWQFMSGMLLREPGRLQVLADDLEAFVHVLTWMCIRYAYHRCDLVTTRTLIHNIYNQTITTDSGDIFGGVAKIDALRTRSHLQFFRFQKSNHGSEHQLLNQLLKRITTLVAVRYNDEDKDDANDDNNGVDNDGNADSDNDNSGDDSGSGDYSESSLSDEDPINANEPVNSAQKEAELDRLKTSDALLRQFNSVLKRSCKSGWPKSDGAVDKLPMLGKRARVDDTSSVATQSQLKCSRVSVAHTYAGARHKEGSNAKPLPSAF